MMVCSGASQRVDFDALDDLFAGFDVGRLDIDCAHAELFVAQAAFVMRRHVVFDQVAVAIDLAHEVGLVASLVKIAVTDLPIVIGADGIVALAYVHHHMHIIRKALDR